jgi:hypothetical protein
MGTAAPGQIQLACCRPAARSKRACEKWRCAAEETLGKQGSLARQNSYAVGMAFVDSVCNHLITKELSMSH